MRGGGASAQEEREERRGKSRHPRAEERERTDIIEHRNTPYRAGLEISKAGSGLVKEKANISDNTGAHGGQGVGGKQGAQQPMSHGEEWWRMACGACFMEAGQHVGGVGQASFQLQRQVRGGYTLF